MDVSLVSLSNAVGPPNQSPHVPISSISATIEAPPAAPIVTAAYFFFPANLFNCSAFLPACAALDPPVATLFALAAFENLLYISNALSPIFTAPAAPILPNPYNSTNAEVNFPTADSFTISSDPCCILPNTVLLKYFSN